ncbi:MAG: hypothetical protein AB7V50_10950 [Vampirovibrionia bacterium]
MKKYVFILLLLMVLSLQVVKADNISRLEIQRYFQNTPGNATYLGVWENKYLNKKVNWTGSIFSIQYQKAFDRTEVTFKILPGTFMYDTVVYVPGDISDKFKLRDEVSFTGSIVKGVDMLGVQEVQVRIGRNMGDQFGNYVFSEDDIVNVNFLQPKVDSEE